MTPREDKGYKVGQVFEVAIDDFLITKKGELMIMTSMNKFALIDDLKSGSTQTYDMRYGGGVKRIYPPEERKVETIELMGKTYDKAEIEKALSGVMPVSD